VYPLRARNNIDNFVVGNENEVFAILRYKVSIPGKENRQD
jgi:hypothetical protein